LRFLRNGAWQQILVDKSIIASANKIVALSDYGVSVTSENAKHLVQYLNDIETYNVENLNEKRSITRLGWIDDTEFSPFMDGIEFDGDSNFHNLYSSITTHGTRKKWIEIARESRAMNPYNKIVLAASFASVLVGPCSALPFFVHLWGSDSGTGKTLAAELGSSVWGDPDRGKYTISMNSTPVGLESFAGFLNSMPLVADELQILKEKVGLKDFTATIYMLTEGLGRIRGEKAGGVRHIITWRNCIITTGETPITTMTSGAGALNRVIDLNCNDKTLFENGQSWAKKIQRNYGFAGKEFVKYLLSDGNMQEAVSMQESLAKELTEKDKTGKQAVSASLIITADRIAAKLFFNDESPMGVEEILPFLLAESDISMNVRAYEWLYGWIAENHDHFKTKAVNGVWGVIEQLDEATETVYIIGKIFNAACDSEGFNPVSFEAWLRQNGKLMVTQAGRGNKIVKKINGVPVRCIALILDDEGTEIEEKAEGGDVPF
jgi:hypothetical protein